MSTTSERAATWNRSSWISLVAVAASIAFAVSANTVAAPAGSGTEIGASPGDGVSLHGLADNRSDGAELTTMDSYMSGQPDAYVTIA
jgi:hypothetical protein